MNKDKGRSSETKLLFPLAGLDLNDDDAIREWAYAVWQVAVETMNGDDVNDAIDALGDSSHEDDEKGSSTVLTDRYSEAVAYASRIHADQVRKGTNTTYLCHLLGVSAMVLEAGGNEDEAIAGLLHDAVEDAGGLAQAELIRKQFGDTVAEIVLACSDSVDPEEKATMSYWERKQRYLHKLEAYETEAQHRALFVSIADKVHNARAIVTDLERTGPSVLTKFNGTPQQICLYYQELLRIARDKGIPDTLTIPLGLAVGVIVDAAQSAQPAPAEDSK